MKPEPDPSLKNLSSPVTSSSADSILDRVSAPDGISVHRISNPATSTFKTSPSNGQGAFDVSDNVEDGVNTNRRDQYLQELTDSRDGLIGARITVHDQRAGLRNDRKNLVDQGARLSQDLRTLAAKATQSELRDLLARHEAITNLTEEIHRKEYEYNDAEDDLIQLEAQVNERESRVYRRLQSNGNQSYDQPQASAIESPPVVEQSNPQPSQIHMSPLEQEVHEKVKIRGTISEELQMLRGRQADLLMSEQRSLRVASGFDRTLGDAASLESSVASLQHELQKIDAEISRLATLPRSLDVSWSLSQFEHDTPAEALDDTSMKAVDSLDPELSTGDPLLLRELDHDASSILTLPSLPDKSVQFEKQPKTANEDVDDWMLNILRRSPLEIRRFRASEKLRSLSLSRTQLARLVLDWWHKDGAVKETKFQPHQTGSVSLAPTSWHARSDILAERSATKYFKHDQWAMLSDMRRPAELQLLPRHSMTSPG